MVQYTDKLSKQKLTQLHNVYTVKSVKTSIYSNLTDWSDRPFRYLKSYIISKQKTSFFKTLLDCFSISLVFILFYFLSIFLCAIDDQCASFYMGGV